MLPIWPPCRHIRIFKGMRETIRHGSTKSLKAFPGNFWKMVNVKVPHPVVHPSSRQAGLCRGDWCLIKPHWFCHCRGVCSHWLWHFAVFGLPCEWPALAVPRHPLGFLGSLIAFLSVTMLEMESVLRSGPIVAHHPKWTAQSSTPGAIHHSCDFNGCRGFLCQP